MEVLATDHPAWLQALWHYDPDYAYDLETYECWLHGTTDPYYIEDGVCLSPNSYHDEFLTAAKANLLRFLELTGQDLPVTREVPVWDVPDLPLARQSRRRLEPDLGVWPTGTRVRRESMLQWEEVGLPRLVVEEYWVCRAHPMQAHAIYQRDGRGLWLARPVPGEQGLYSPVLGTRVRIHEENGFQCQDPETEQWIEAHASFYHEGYGEGQYWERRQSLLALAEVLCTAQELANLRAELEAVDPQAWPNIKDLYKRYRLHGKGSR